MSKRTVAQLKLLTNQTINTNNNQEITGLKDNQLRQNVIDSFFNLADGALVDNESGYSTAITPSFDYSFATKKYVDDHSVDLSAYIRLDGTSPATTGTIKVGEGFGFEWFNDIGTDGNQHTTVLTASQDYINMSITVLSDVPDTAENTYLTIANGGASLNYSLTNNTDSTSFGSSIGVNAGGILLSAGSTGQPVLLDTSQVTSFYNVSFPNKDGSDQVFAMVSDITSAVGAYLPLAGGVDMTGQYNLSADASTALQPTTLQQVVAMFNGYEQLQTAYDASGNTFPVASNTSPVVSAIKKGMSWYISVAGILGGFAVAQGDEIIALIDSPGQTSANWLCISHTIGYMPLPNTLNSGNIFVGNGSNNAVGVALSLNASAGPFGLSNAGILTIPDAATTTRGLLNSTDWNIFNGKQSPATTLAGYGITDGLTGSGTNTRIPIYNGTSTFTTNNAFTFSGTTANTPSLAINGASGAGYIQLLNQATTRPTGVSGLARMYSSGGVGSSTSELAWARMNNALSATIYREQVWPDANTTITYPTPDAGGADVLAYRNSVNTFSVNQNFFNVSIQDITTPSTNRLALSANNVAGAGLAVGIGFSSITLNNSTQLGSSSQVLTVGNISSFTAARLNIGNMSNSITSLRIGGVFTGTSYLTTYSSGSLLSGVDILTPTNTGTGGTANININTGLNTGGGVRGLLQLDAGNINMFSTTNTGFGGGTGIMFVNNATTAPTSNPTAGYFNWAADDGSGSNIVPWVRTSGGNIIKFYTQTTSVASATLATAGLTAIMDGSTFDGYTIQQVVKALRNAGLLQ